MSRKIPFLQMFAALRRWAELAQAVEGWLIVSAAIDKASETLGKEGRVIVRPSGTEPLLRVMVEGRDEALIEKLAQDVAKVIEQELV